MNVLFLIGSLLLSWVYSVLCKSASIGTEPYMCTLCPKWCLSTKTGGIISPCIPSSEQTSGNLSYTSLWQLHRIDSKHTGPGKHQGCAVITSWLRKSWCPLCCCLGITYIHCQTCRAWFAYGRRGACLLFLCVGFCWLPECAAMSCNHLVCLELHVKLPFIHESEKIVPLKYDKIYQLVPEFSRCILVLTFTKEKKWYLQNYIF